MAEEFDPEALARAVAIDTAQDASHVGDFVTSETTCDGVTDFRFVATMVGYEGWQWSVTLFHDVGADRWTVDEASLIPTDKALLPPPWVPWKDRLEPSDLSVTDSIGTDPGDERLEAGVTEEAVERIETTHGPVDEAAAKDAVRGPQTAETIAGTRLDAAAAVVEGVETVTEAVEDVENVEEGRRDADGADGAGSATTQQDLHDAIEEFDLSRRSVMSPIGRAQTAQRWYDGPHGPKSLSTKTANGNVCSTCGFFISLRGDLSEMFGVCANRWSPDDGRVVSLDHGCGEHSQIEPPEPSRLWIQTKPAYDDVHIDIVAQSPREERGEVELIETIVDAKRHGVAGGLHGADAADGDDVRREERRAVQGAVVPMPDADAQREAARDAIADEAAADAPRQAQAQQIVDAAEDIVTDEQRETVAATGDEDTIGHTQVVAELTTDAEGEGEDFVDALEAKAEAAQDADAAATTADAGASAAVEPEDAAQQETLERAEIEVENIAGAASDATQGNEDVVEPYQEAHD